MWRDEYAWKTPYKEISGTAGTPLNRDMPASIPGQQGINAGHEIDRRRLRRGKIQQPVRLDNAIIAYADHFFL
jgi:hypothetical protein